MPMPSFPRPVGKNNWHTEIEAILTYLDSATTTEVAARTAADTALDNDIQSIPDSVMTFTNKTLTSPVINTPTGNVARGILGYAQITAQQTGITTPVAITGLSTTVTVGTNRRLKVTLVCRMDSSVAGDTLCAYIIENALTLNRAENTVALANRGDTMIGMWQGTLSAGVHTFLVQAERVVGSGTANFNAATNNPAFIMVEDIGPAS